LVETHDQKGILKRYDSIARQMDYQCGSCLLVVPKLVPGFRSATVFAAANDCGTGDPGW